MRLIDADAMKDKQFGAFGWLAGKDLAAAPTIDAVPVVRCRECKYFKDWGNGCKTCYFWTDQYDMPTDEDEFCSYGERKGE